MGVRTSLSALLTSSALAGPVRVSLSALTVAEALAGKVRVSFTGGVIANSLWGHARVSGTYLVVARSVNFGVEFNRLESNSAIYGILSWGFALSGLSIPEHNPYKPTIPESVIDTAGPETYDYLKENQETIRQQHNLTQAGDTTFPSEMFTTSHQIKHYTLGSLTRFYHADYGIIQGRYVKFDKMVPTNRPCVPVGLIGRDATEQWVVTNDYDLSHPDLVVGISAPWNTPADGDYGWVIVDGPVLQPLDNESTTSTQGEAFSWSGTGKISNTAKGKVVARRVNRVKDNKLPVLAGEAYVRVESFSENQIADVVAENTKQLSDSLSQLSQQVADLPDLATLGDAVNSLKQQLNQEMSNRQTGDQALQQQLANLDFVTPAQLDAAVTAASTAINATITNLTNVVNGIIASVNALKEKVNSMSGIESNLQSQIDGLMTLILSLRAKKVSKFPVVDGSIPPNLVYLDDGSLVYVET